MFSYLAKIKKKIIAVPVVYVVLVIAFETFLGIMQPSSGDTMVITSFEANGEAINRVVSRLEKGSNIFVAVNHWPRAWARRIRLNPNVQITYNETTLNYSAVILEGGEHDKAVSDFPVPLAFRVLTGFPPRYFFRFELQEGAG